jgi:hypothetical protein
MRREKSRHLARRFLKDESGSGIVGAVAMMIMIPLVILFIVFVLPGLSVRECIRKRDYLRVAFILTVNYLPAYLIAYGLFAIYRS